MYEISVSQSFDAAHFLREYRGRCARMHGHTWKVEAVVEGEELGPSQLLVDFNDLKGLLREVVDDFDHACLNDLPPFDRESPTSENVARIIFQRLQGKVESLGTPVRLLKVRVSESPETSVVYAPRP
jgi:6-pyruvoyltetrahydropterin/6-carboxytetrahydropterin synthase